ncbi:MAG: hypothetical protein V4622_12360 [Bacteroidota bacterium]
MKKHCTFSILHFQFLTIVSIIVLSFNSNAQISLPNSFDSIQYKFTFNLKASHDFQSSAISNEFSSKLIKGGFIDENLINSTFDKHKKINRLGREFTNELKITNSCSKIKKWDILYEAGYFSIFSANYSKDLFGLIFKGNQDYIGDTADFSGSSFQYVGFQTLGFGLSHKKSKSSFSLNLVNVDNYFSSFYPKASIIFAADSSQMDVDLKGNLDRTYTKKFDKGFGLALNFNVNIEVPWKDDSKAFFQFQVQNLGFAKVDQIIENKIDTNIVYSGFNFDNLMSLNTNYLENNLWQDTLNISQDTISKFVMLPTMIQFGKVLNANSSSKIQSFFGVKMYPTLRYVPKIYFGIDYLIAKSIHLGLTSAYGGFGNFRVGFYANYAASKFDFGLGTEDVYGCFSKQAMGQMFNVRMKFNF